MPSATLSSLLARLPLTRRRVLIAGLALAPLLIAAVIAGIVAAAPAAQPAVPAPPAANAQAAGSLPPPAGLLVEVTGAVARPGVYRVAKGERACAAIAAAGGLTIDADPGRLPNMAARLKDGEQLKVPSLTTPATTRSTGTGPPRVAKVSLNAATEEQLATVPGFTPELAAAVIQYRTEFGGFTATKELVDVLGMSAADYALARSHVTT